ncbi:MAG TPA: hypothetical protein VFY94_04690 [Rhodanobacteraceae bacterium]|jgi:hypothetical protein|nr:hypothetical protein [Rhodanobacteraceae bacterium]
MNIKTAFAVAILALSTAAGAAGAAEPQTTSGWFASRIVGAYQSEARVRVCGSPGPDEVVFNTIIFNAGGTVIATPRFPPQGADNYSRTNDLGTWSYHPRTNRYSVKLRYDNFMNGAFTGSSVVERDLQMSADSNSVTGPVHVTTHAPDGSVVVEVCGTATSTRL